jgi:hypothetical protein
MIENKEIDNLIEQGFSFWQAIGIWFSGGDE